jgi:hypothetical protein
MPATPSLTTIRDAIVSAIKSAMNSGTPGNVLTVHSYRRFWRDAQKFNSLFLRLAPDLLPGKINGWYVTRLATREVESPEWFRFYQVHRWQLDGFFGIQDDDATATEKVFQDQIEAIRDNLRLNATVFQSTEYSNPVTQVQTIEPITIGDSTVWHGVLVAEAEAVENKF